MNGALLPQSSHQPQAMQLLPQRQAGRPCCALTSSSAARLPGRTRRLAVRAAAEERAGGGFNPFGKKDPKKQDAAKKALEDMFKGKKDYLAAYDPKPPKGGGGDGGGGGGGGWGGFDDFSDFGDKFWGWLRGLGTTLGTILAFVAAISVTALWQPMIALFVGLVRWALRLDGRGSRRARPQAALNAEQAAGLGENEASVLGKYGAGDEPEEGAGADDDDDDV